MELLFDHKIKGWLKRFVDIMYSTTEFKRKVFVLFVKVLLPCNNKWINAFLFIDRAWVSNPNILQEDLPFILQIRSYKIGLVNLENYDETYDHTSDLCQSAAW